MGKREFNGVVFMVLCLWYASVTYDHKAIVIDGKRIILISGSIHYPRSTPQKIDDRKQVWSRGMGKAYTKWAAQMAVGLDIDVPCFMCKQEDAPPDPVVS
ncbi:hypothetical protein VNO78_11069 [Psophocarpus tetragonolobus]|uniref:Beta-galactosidase n=1 Tax=Psophocarpus tetragonolobus TaxID=3891 RepID=A0AAN9SKU3_PSOTE